MNTDCLFCQLREERIIGQCDLTITFLDSYPASPGHVLIIPKRHVATYFDITEQEQNAIAKAIQKAKLILDEEFSPDGYNIGVNNGKAAGQSIMHLHVHLIPRYKDDVENPKGGVRWVISNKADYWSNRDK
ncbi:histidine triad (HIT) protein [Abyssogena phaseoliformis symbiont OG214]|uniref:HIT family protein n=1 Tax=Abyssogena phaseoliformis symbiont TaxID=596095 RepID=UPI001915CDA5|nr:HIT family protein [Abyssogena phaseoliformis symbiont]MBW5289227.1 HIT family hydrolase [Candidatus Ruthia sp. Apha_13_S6]BBB22745.1 histidine triad (HIT) protein [Abyssogena phaseoliformis symbiont OG214]